MIVDDDEDVVPSVDPEPVPVLIRGTVVAALFKWMMVSSSTNSNSSSKMYAGLPTNSTLLLVKMLNFRRSYLIPWHHFHSKSLKNEKDGYDVMSRVRSYLLTNPVAFVPEQNLPLLVHAIALFDAHQVANSIFVFPFLLNTS